MSRCKSANKIMHSTQGSAIQHAAELMQKGSAERRPLHVYQCPACGEWHVGHKPRVQPTVRLAAVEVQAASVHAEPRCECNCKKAAREVVQTARGSLACCPRHARRLKAVHVGQGHAQ